MKINKLKLSDLSNVQTMHLAWRLDRQTGLGLVQIRRIIDMKFGDLEVEQIWLNEDKTSHSAKILTTKIKNFKIKGSLTG